MHCCSAGFLCLRQKLVAIIQCWNTTHDARRSYGEILGWYINVIGPQRVSIIVAEKRFQRTLNQARWVYIGTLTYRCHQSPAYGNASDHMSFLCVMKNSICYKQEGSLHKTDKTAQTEQLRLVKCLHPCRQAWKHAWWVSISGKRPSIHAKSRQPFGLFWGLVCLVSLGPHNLTCFYCLGHWLLVWLLLQGWSRPVCGQNTCEEAA